MARRKETIDVSNASDVQEAKAEELEAARQLHDEIKQIPLLAPWTGFTAHDTSLSDELNQELARRVRELVFEDLALIYKRLQRQKEERDAAGILPKRASQTLLENRLVVEAKCKVDLHQIAENVKIAMQTAAVTMVSPTIRTRRVSSTSSTSSSSSTSTQQRHAWYRKSSVTSSHHHSNDPAAGIHHTQELYGHRGPHGNGEKPRASHENGDELSTDDAQDEQTDQDTRPLLSVQFPRREQTLAQAVQEAEVQLAADPSNQNDQVLHFRNRPVAIQSAIFDAGKPTPRREPQRDRVRYIMSTRLGALPPTKNILDEYPIPKEILDALEKHRHYHVDESSLMTSFDPIKTGGSGNSGSAAGDWECYVRRSVPVERKPISFVLASLEVASERPVPPPSDIFHQHVLESATNDELMLTEVRQLYDYTHESYREFRSTLHRHLELQYLVDLSFRSSLNSTSYFIDDVVSNEPSIKIPDRLLRAASSSSSPVSKWRLAKSGVSRISHRRGAIAVHVKAETNAKTQRAELLNKLCTFTPHEIQLMELWYTHDADANSEHPFDPVPMSPALSARFDAVWHELQMPAKERLDLAVKYSSMENSSRLADAVVLWETSAAIIKEREELLGIIKVALAAPKKNAAMIAEETAMLQDLVTCDGNLKEILMLTYLEVGDFVALSGNFYLARMEHEATELRRLIVESIEYMKHRSVIEDAVEAVNSSSHNITTSSTNAPVHASAVAAAAATVAMAALANTRKA